MDMSRGSYLPQSTDLDWYISPQFNVILPCPPLHTNVLYSDPTAINMFFFQSIPVFILVALLSLCQTVWSLAFTPPVRAVSAEATFLTSSRNLR